MEFQNIVMPEKCVKCEAVFDLIYDLKEGEFDGEFLCWNCRSIEKGEESEVVEFEDDFLEDFE